MSGWGVERGEFAAARRGADKGARKYRNARIGAGGWGGKIVVEAIASNRARVFA